jgi:hypothetical protein
VKIFFKSEAIFNASAEPSCCNKIKIFLPESFNVKSIIGKNFLSFDYVSSKTEEIGEEDFVETIFFNIVIGSEKDNEKVEIIFENSHNGYYGMEAYIKEKTPIEPQTIRPSKGSGRGIQAKTKSFLKLGAGCVSLNCKTMNVVINNLDKV